MARLEVGLYQKDLVLTHPLNDLQVHVEDHPLEYGTSKALFPPVNTVQEL